MRTILFACSLAVALALPATAMAVKPVDKTNAAKECKAERGETDATKEAFALKYKNFGACVSKRAKEEAAERKEARTNAAKECREERGDTDASRQAFAEKYGTNENNRNAFGKCVSGKAKKAQKKEDAQDLEEIQEFKNAAKECDAERGETTESQQAFAEKYGTNKNDKNAFGKCVSGKTHES
jgi:hypothetical protein